MRHLLLALPFALLPLVAAQAHEHGHDHDHEHAHDSLGAHEHGVTSLNARWTATCWSCNSKARR